jgi:hypothetical protein
MKPPRLPSVLPDRDACPPKTATPPGGHRIIQLPQVVDVAPLAVPHEVEDKVTGVLEGEALKTARGKRDTKERLERVETKQDEDRARLGRMEVTLAGINGQMQVLPQLVTAVQDATRALEQRDQVRERAKTEVETAEKIDDLDARKKRREFWWGVAGKVAGFVLSAAVLGKVLAWAGVL